MSFWARLPLTELAHLKDHCFSTHRVLYRSQEMNWLAPLLALLIFVRDSFLTTSALLPSHLSENPHHEQIWCSLSHTSCRPKTPKIFIAEIEFWLRIALAQLAHLTKGAGTNSRVLYCSPKLDGLGTLLALLLIAFRDALLTTSVLLPGQLLTTLLLRILLLADA